MARLFDAALPRALKTPGELPKSRGPAAWRRRLGRRQRDQPSGTSKRSI